MQMKCLKNKLKLIRERINIYPQADLSGLLYRIVLTLLNNYSNRYLDLCERVNELLALELYNSKR